MDRHRYVAWVFVGALVLLLAAPWLLPQQTWAALLSSGFNWQKGVVLMAFAGMAAAYAYWLVQLVQWVRTLSFNTHRDPRYFPPGQPLGAMDTSCSSGRMSDGASGIDTAYQVRPVVRPRLDEGGE
ncbi:MULTISPECIES: hypothetical protein [Burkholderiales]|uniref:hypothetical protein n=1 Tax=Burkholderiales TaxID=80840 RepID=UPI003016E0B0